MTRVTKLRAHAISQELLAQNSGLELTNEGKLSALPILTQVTGGLTYKGLFNPITGTPDPVVTNAKQGWFYKISHEGTWLGLNLKIGDNIYFNQDILETDNASDIIDKVDVIDNTESVTELNDLSDVTLGTLNTGNVIYWNGLEFTNKFLNISDIVNLQTNLNLKQSEIDLIESSIGLLSSGSLSPFQTLGVASGKTTFKAAIEALSDSGSSLDSTLYAAKTELDLTQASLGLLPSGSLSPFTINGVVSGKSTFKDAIDALSLELSSVDTERQATQSELDLTQTSVGLLGSGSLSPFTLTGVAAGKLTFKAAIDALSVELNTVDIERQATQSQLDLTQASVGLLASGSLSPFTLTGVAAGKLTHKAAIDALSVELLDARTDLQAELDLTQASVGLLASGSLSPFTLTGVAAGKTTIKAAIDALSASGFQQGNDIFATQTEMDLTQASIGLLASGSLSPFTGIFTSGKTTHKAAIEALDTRLDEKPDHIVYVSGEFGNNTYNGALYTPKQTIAAALSSLPNDGSKAAIYLFPGNYSENLTVNRVNTTVAGLSAAGRAGHITSISGSISIEPTVTAGGVFNNFVIFENLLISQSGVNPAINLGGTFLYQAHFRNCQVFSDNTTVSLVKANATVNSRLYFYNCSLTYTGNSAFHTIELAKGELYTDICEIYRTGGTSASRAIVLSGTASAVRMSSTLLTVSGCARAVELSGVGNNLTLGNSVIGNSTANSTGIYVGAGAIATALYTFFDVATAAGTGHIVDGAAGSVFVYGYNLYANDITIGASVTRVPLAKDLATVATTGAYSDLSGKPTLATVATSGAASDVSVSGAPVNFVALNQTVEAFLDGIDTKIGTIDTSIAAAGKVESVNGISPVLPSKNVVIDASNILADYEAQNYVGASTYSISEHLSGIDIRLEELTNTDNLTTDHSPVNYTETNISTTGHFAGIDNALGIRVKNVNGILPVAGVITLDADDLFADRVGINYTAAATLSIKGHLSAIDTALGNAGSVATVNNVAPDGSKNVSIDGNDIPSDYLATNYIASSTLSIKGHLSAIDTSLGTKASSVNGVSAIGGAITIDADNLTADRTGINYIAASTLSVKAHLSAIDTALSTAGLVATVNSIQPDGSKNVLLDADDIKADHTGVNYTAASTLSVKAHLSAIDTTLGSKATTVNGVSAVAGSVTFDADNLVADYTATNYIASSTLSVKAHLSAIDTKIGGIDSSLATKGTVESVNNVSAVGSNVTIDADNILADRIGINYIGASTLSIKGHLAGIDTKIGTMDSAISSKGVVNTVNSVSAIAGNVLIDADDIKADYLATNYIAAATLSIKGHLSAINTSLGEKATSVNGVSAVAGVITFDADSLVADRTGIAYTASTLQSVKQHLNAIDIALSLRGNTKTVNGASPDINGAVVFDADSIVADRNGTNYTAASTLSVKAHLAAIDAALGGLGGASGALTFIKNTSSFTALANSHHSVDTTSGVVAVTIPALNTVGIVEGTRIRVRLTVRGGTNNVTITSTSPLNGVTSPLILSFVGEYAEFFANKTDNVWEVLL